MKELVREIMGGLLLSIGLSVSLKIVHTTNNLSITTEPDIGLFIAGIIAVIIGITAIIVDFTEINKEFDEQLDTLKDNLAINGVSPTQANWFWRKATFYTETREGIQHHLYIIEEPKDEEYTTITIKSKKESSDKMQTITINEVYLFTLSKPDIDDDNTNQIIQIFAGQQELIYKPFDYVYLKIKRTLKKRYRRPKDEYL